MSGLLDIPSSSATLDRHAASRDLWPRTTLSMWQGGAPVLPDRVWWPTTDEDVATVLRAASDRFTPVVPYGAGSGVCGGATGRAGAWVIDTKRLNRIGRVDHRWVVEAEAGVNGQHLEDELARQGFTLGHSPSSIGCSTVGGWAAARSAGQFSSRYGVFDDMVMGLDAVAPGVGAFHLGLPGEGSPATHGADEWMPMLLGSEGTLAVITRVRMRVRPLPQARWLRGYLLPDVDTALGVMRRLMQAELWPAVVRLYDPLDTLIGGQTRPRSHRSQEHRWWRSWLRAVDGLNELRRRSLILPLALPGLVQRVVEGRSSGCLLVVGWEGRREVVDAAVAAAQPMLGAVGRDLGAEVGERWYAARHAVSYKLMPVFERGGFADTMEVAGRWSVLGGTYAAVRDALRDQALVMAHMSHVYPEGACIYFSFAGRGDLAFYDRVWEQALNAVLASGATTTHHHGVGVHKAAAVTRETGAAAAGWRQLKSELDPAGVMNPGTLYVTAPTGWSAAAAAPPPPPDLAPEDGLVWVPVRSNVKRLGETRWSWQRLDDVRREAREPWQSTWLEVRGQVDGQPVALVRGPRSAAGPDLRPYLAERDPDAIACVGHAPEGPRWMGTAQCDRPWAVAQAILRADLRPAMLGVVDGWLKVGFRGPGAEAFGRLAAAVVPGGLETTPWQVVQRATGAMVPCEAGGGDGAGDPRIVAVTSETAWRRADGEPP